MRYIPTRRAWLWAGLYREPARYRDVDARVHTTAGFRFRLFRRGSFGLYFNAAVDSADRFEVWTTSFTVGPGKF